MALEPYQDRLIKAIAEQIRDRKSLLFFPDCKESAGAAQMLRDLGIDAKHVDTTYMEADESESILKWFKTAEKGSCLTNASLLTTGYDQPDIDCIAPIRIIRSTPLYKQIVGRGTRPVANLDGLATAEERRNAIALSSKPHLLLLDLMLQNDDHDFASPTVLISDLKSEEDSVKKFARQMPEGNLDEFRVKLEERRLEGIKLKKAAEQAAKAAVKQTNEKKVFIGDILLKPMGQSPATPKQIKYARYLGCRIDWSGVTNIQAQKIIGRYLSHIEKQKSK